MTAAEVQRLFVYNAWANERTFGALAGIPAESYRADMKSSHGGIHGTMLHIIFAQHLWLLRWMGQPHDAAFEGSKKAASLDALRSHWLDVEKETRAFLDARLNDAFLRETFVMKTTNGEAFTHTYGESMLHLVNHSSYHRGQVATLMRQAGHVPPATDYILHARQLRPGGDT